VLFIFAASILARLEAFVQLLCSVEGCNTESRTRGKEGGRAQRDLLVVIPDSSLSIHSIRTTRKKKKHIDFTR
jgi:hypothetical protein